MHALRFTALRHLPYPTASIRRPAAALVTGNQMLQLGLNKTKAAAVPGVHRNTLNAYLEQKPLK